jgi:chorismate mutase
MTGGVRVDPVVERLRAAITALDERLVGTLNERIELVAELHRHKATAGLPAVDRDRERALLEHLTEVNAGPISEAGLAELHRFVLALVKREVARA